MITFKITNKISIPYISESADDFIYDALTMPNPVFLENKRMKRFNWKTPKELFFYEEVGKEGLYAPRGFLEDILCYCFENEIDYKKYLYPGRIDKRTGKINRPSYIVRIIRIDAVNKIVGLSIYPLKKF